METHFRYMAGFFHQNAVPAPVVTEKIKKFDSLFTGTDQLNESVTARLDKHEEHVEPTPSPPSSPSKHGRLGLFKRTKGQSQDSTLSRKVKGSLHINTNLNGTFHIIALF